jgi:DNA-binding NarL/FixJ family response regulator
MGQTTSEASEFPINVHLLTENRLLRDSLARLLPRRAGICVVGVSETINAAANEISNSQCEIVLTDCLTSEPGTALLSGLSGCAPRVRVVLFGMDHDLEHFLKSAHLGIGGYVLKEASASEIIEAIRGVARGEAVCPPELLMGLLEHLAQEFRAAPKACAPAASSKPSLTQRQIEVMELVAKGLTNKEIAGNLFLSEFTVKNHLRRIMRQMDAPNRHAAAQQMRDSGSFPSA